MHDSSAFVCSRMGVIASERIYNCASYLNEFVFNKRKQNIDVVVSLVWTRSRAAPFAFEPSVFFIILAYWHQG